MNPVKQIGRYQLPILNIAGVKARQGWLVKLKLRKPGYDVVLLNGHVIHFTPEEKQKYDEEIELHETVMQVWGMCKSAGQRA